jgi:hypothetical protein
VDELIERPDMPCCHSQNPPILAESLLSLHLIHPFPHEADLRLLSDLCDLHPVQLPLYLGSVKPETLGRPFDRSYGVIIGVSQPSGENTEEISKRYGNQRRDSKQFCWWWLTAERLFCRDTFIWNQADVYCFISIDVTLDAVLEHMCIGLAGDGLDAVRDQVFLFPGRVSPVTEVISPGHTLGNVESAKDILIL